MSQGTQELEDNFLPATQPSQAQDRAVGSVATFLWTKDAACVKTVTDQREGPVSSNIPRRYDDNHDPPSHFAQDEADYAFKGGREGSRDSAVSLSQVPPAYRRGIPSTTDTQSIDGRVSALSTSRAPIARSLVSSTQSAAKAPVADHGRITQNWKVSRFASRSQPAPSRAFPLRRSQESTDDDDEQIEDDVQPPKPLSSTKLNGRNWRIPLQARAQDAAMRKSNVDLADAQEVEMQLGAADGEDADLPGLQSTDESESDQDDDVAMDAIELQDFLRYRLPTGLRQLDKRLGLEAQHACLLFGDESLGLSNGGILEVAGTPGSGKTTLLMQLALQERISALLQAAASVTPSAAASDSGHEKQSGAAREVVIIDTEGSISAERLYSMANDLAAKGVAKAKNLHEPPDPAILVEHTLAGIHLLRCTEMADLLAALEVLLPSADYPEAKNDAEQQVADRVLEAWDDMQMPPNTSLIVMDSISHLFRSAASDDAIARRNRQHAFACVRTFCANVHSWGIKLVVSNQLSSVFVTSQGQRTRMGDARGGTAYMRPTMRQWLDEHTEAEAWRVMLYFGHPLRDDRRVKIVARPTSVNEIKYLDEAYWSSPTCFRINVHGVIEDVD